MIKEAGKILGVEFINHSIIGLNNSYYTLMREEIFSMFTKENRYITRGVNKKLDLPLRLVFIKQ